MLLNNTDFWTNYITYETKFAQQYNAQLLGPLVANNDVGQQITDIHTLIQEGAQALIVNPVDSAAIAPALDYAASKHIPVVSVDVAPSAGSVYMIVRADNVAYGMNSCKYIASLNGKDRSDGCKQVAHDEGSLSHGLKDLSCPFCSGERMSCSNGYTN